MEIYIDLIYIVNSILGFFCLMSLSILTGKVVSLKKTIGLSLLWGLHVCSLYSKESIYYGFVGIISLLFDHKHFFRNMIILLFIHETLINSLFGVSRIGNVLIITSDFDWVLPMLMGFLILFFYLGMWFSLRKEAHHQQFVYDVLVRSDEHYFHLKGFMDTGNQAVFEGIPIVFLKKDLFPPSIQTGIQTINGKENVFLSKGEIYFKDSWHPCMFSTTTQLVINEDCLLNYYLL